MTGDMYVREDFQDIRFTGGKPVPKVKMGIAASKPGVNERGWRRRSTVSGD
jgi:hypothetical protein